MTVDHSGECECGVWPASACTRCSGKDAAVRAEQRRLATTIDYEFEARLESIGQCGHRIDPGEWAARMLNGAVCCHPCAKTPSVRF